MLKDPQKYHLILEPIGPWAEPFTSPDARAYRDKVGKSLGSPEWFHVEARYIIRDRKLGAAVRVYRAENGDVVAELERRYFNERFQDKWFPKRRHEAGKFADSWVLIKPIFSSSSDGDRAIEVAWSSGPHAVVVSSDYTPKPDDLTPILKAYLAKFPSDLRPESLAKNYREWARKDNRKWMKAFESAAAPKERERPYYAMVENHGRDPGALFGDKETIEWFLKHMPEAEEEKKAFSLMLSELTGFQMAKPEDWHDWWKKNRDKSQVERVRMGLDQMFPRARNERGRHELFVVMRLIRITGQDSTPYTQERDAQGKYKPFEVRDRELTELQEWWKRNRDTFVHPIYGPE